MLKNISMQEGKLCDGMLLLAFGVLKSASWWLVVGWHGYFRAAIDRLSDRQNADEVSKPIYDHHHHRHRHRHRLSSGDCDCECRVVHVNHFN